MIFTGCIEKFVFPFFFHKAETDVNVVLVNRLMTADFIMTSFKFPLCHSVPSVKYEESSCQSFMTNATE